MSAGTSSPSWSQPQTKGAKPPTPKASIPGEKSQEDPAVLASKEQVVMATQSLSSSIIDMVRGEFQGTMNEYEHLERMNLRATEEYKNFGDFSAGLSVYVERLRHKNDMFHEHLKQLDEIDHELLELENVVATLDNYTGVVEAKLRAAL